MTSPSWWQVASVLVGAVRTSSRSSASFLPEGRIISHDVTAEDLVTVATPSGEPIRVDARIAESDLVVSVDICHGPREPMSFAVGATDEATINRTSGFDGSDSARREVATAIHGAIPIFSVTAVLGQPYLGRQLSFMNHCEWEWRLPEQVAYATARQFVSLMPRQGTQKLYAAPRADYELCDVIGGDPAQVATRAAEVWPTKPCAMREPMRSIPFCGTRGYSSLFIHSAGSSRTGI